METLSLSLFRSANENGDGESAGDRECWLERPEIQPFPSQNDWILAGIRPFPDRWSTGGGRRGKMEGGDKEGKNKTKKKKKKSDLECHIKV